MPPPATSDPNWARDEVVLALDVFVRFGSLDGGPIAGVSSPEVQNLSKELNALQVHPMSARTAKFRNPNGVGMKLANLRAAEREVRLQNGDPGAEALPKGSGHGAAADRAAFAEFYDQWPSLHQEAAAIRSTLRTPQSPKSSPPEGRVHGLDAPVDGGGVAEYEASPTNGGTRTRSEAEMVQAYADHMTASKHEVTGRHYPVTDESRVLRADLLIRDLNILIEAKATVSRTAIRLAIGQLFDYRRYEDTDPDLALLVPEKPTADMLILLSDLSIGCVWPYGDGYADTMKGKLRR